MPSNELLSIWSLSLLNSMPVTSGDQSHWWIFFVCLWSVFDFINCSLCFIPQDTALPVTKGFFHRVSRFPVDPGFCLFLPVCIFLYLILLYFMLYMYIFFRFIYQVTVVPVQVVLRVSRFSVLFSICAVSVCWVYHTKLSIFSFKASVAWLIVYCSVQEVRP